MAEPVVPKSQKTVATDGATACLAFLDTLLPRDVAMRCTLELCATICADFLGVSPADALALSDACAPDTLPRQTAIPSLFAARARGFLSADRESLRTAGGLGDVYEALLAE